MFCCKKTLLNIEGLGRQLDPELDLWDTAKPFLDRWMNDQVGVRALLKGIRKHMPKVMEQAPELPALVHQYFDQVVQQPKQQRAELKREIERLEKTLKQQRVLSVAAAVSTMFAALAIAYYL